MAVVAVAGFLDGGAVGAGEVPGVVVVVEGPVVVVDEVVVVVADEAEVVEVG